MVVVGGSELTWAFTPAGAVEGRAAQLVAFAMLEDLAGNRIGRAFEVDQFDRTDKSAEPEKTLIPFVVKYGSPESRITETRLLPKVHKVLCFRDSVLP